MNHYRQNIFEDSAAGLAAAGLVARVRLLVFAVWGLVALVRLLRLVLQRKVEGTVTAVERRPVEGEIACPALSVSYTVDGLRHTSVPLHGDDELLYAGVPADAEETNLIGRPMTLRVSQRRPE